MNILRGLEKFLPFNITGVSAEDRPPRPGPEAREAARNSQITRVTDEANDLSERSFDYFYSSTNVQFQAKVQSAETKAADHDFGYLVWPVIITVQTLYECQSTWPGPWSRHKAGLAMGVLHRYWSPGRHAYLDWRISDGNEDIDYYHNALACQALISAFEATREDIHLDKVKEIFTHLIIPAAEGNGSLPRSASHPTLRSAFSTGCAAVAALRYITHIIFPLSPENARILEFAEQALNWINVTLRDPRPTRGLIRESISIQYDGSTKINERALSCNTGFAIHGFALLHTRTNEQRYLRIASELAKAAMSDISELTFPILNDGRSIMYRDSPVYLHHLVDGYRALAVIDVANKERIDQEITRIANWGRLWMYDPCDMLYFRGTHPYTIDKHKRRRFNGNYSLRKKFIADPRERDRKGKLCKTLIANASWARILRGTPTLRAQSQVTRKEIRDFTCEPVTSIPHS